ncbi:uncharacterized protein L969DRAFT_55078 [Mixia osmundae IAM 14324]|uniref:Bola-like protein n=1 Tax=Mixia osmundae (strain CBS 9802 / IAM 14324 / JCM 22182 / KY 12970) TaxID=764103 RepID=G7DUK5_MIXOS|nr:uncharacterized protein L969DRAFT_55078 [Mixia osmundae IAM 14324]KEI36401.1 hypothetical protein L969DRAFT_55078 [Mixia osmundae IAM 14324]GAA94265.1 hypothetical protein E5Q_00914 [Mixia osmundae IAM 14324]
MLRSQAAMRMLIRPSWLVPRQSARSTMPVRGYVARSSIPPTQQPSNSPDRSPLEPSEAYTPVDSSSSVSSADEDGSTQTAARGMGGSAQTDEGTSSESATLLSKEERAVMEKLEGIFKGGRIEVQDVSGGCGSFFAISIAHKDFKGLSTIKQHRVVNEALAEEVKNWHGIQLKTAPM